MFYEIDYDASPIPGVGKFVIKPEKLREQVRDPVRELFGQMRDIAREEQVFKSAKFLDSRLSRSSAEVFYRQGMFMKDFSDNYTGFTPCNDRIPLYQHMGYEQLRSYFTWRTGVRMGEVAETSEAYVFLYMYELLGNIGANDPMDGINKIMFLWEEYSAYDSHLNYYVPAWLRDYFIYYPLSQPFLSFVHENGLAGYYDDIDNEEDDDFSKFLAVSKYNIKKSAFFTSERESLIVGCFCHVLYNLRLLFLKNGIDFDESVFELVGRKYEWKPFQGAVFFEWMKQEDRRVQMSKKMIHFCKNSRWQIGRVSVNENGRQLVGFIFKQMESVLRSAMGFKHKISASTHKLFHPAVVKLKMNGISLENVISKLTQEFYREATKTVVEVDAASLLQIRREALEIQGKLIVEEEVALVNDMTTFVEEKLARTAVHDSNSSDKASLAPTENILAGANDSEWSDPSKHGFTETEIKALAAALAGEAGIRQIAAEHGIMPEVLADGINEKAMDLIGDSLLDTEFNIYEDYKDQIKDLI